MTSPVVTGLLTNHFIRRCVVTSHQDYTLPTQQQLTSTCHRHCRTSSEQLNGDPLCCHNKVFITSKHFEDHPVNLIRKEGEPPYSFT